LIVWIAISSRRRSIKQLKHALDRYKLNMANLFASDCL
jgi:hypothetical protein